MGSSSLTGFTKMTKTEIMLMNAGKGLLLLPSSSNEIVSLLQELEKRLQRVQQMPSESMIYAMQPVIEALIAKELLRHPHMDVNISVACCISEVFRIMVYKTPYSDEQMKDFFELVVIALEKLSSASGGWNDRMFKALKTLDMGKFSLMMCDLQLDGLIVRLFKQFLTVADSNSSAVVTKMKQIMVMILEKTEPVNHMLVDLLVTSVRKENKIASPVCWQLGRDVLERCATQLKPHLPKKVAEEVYSPLMETIPSTTGTSKLGKGATRKRKHECLDGSRNMVQPLRRCRDVKKRKKKTLSTDDPPMPTNIVTEAQSVEHGENLVGRRIKVWWSTDKTYYQGVVKSFDCRKKRHKVLYDDGEEELLDLKQEQWKLAEMASRLSMFEIKLMNAGKGLLILPSSTAELLNVLEQMEKLLHRVQLHKWKQTLSESMKYAMRPIIEALIAKELLRHPDMGVNISVACCICDVLKIMDYNTSYNDEQMKDFFELAVITFEKLSSASGGCYTKLFKVLRTLSRLSYSLLKSDLLLKGLIVRLFKQFVTSADGKCLYSAEFFFSSNSSRAVFKMKQIMIFIIEKSELLDLELVDLLVTRVRKENQITSHVCWKLGNEVLKKCAAKLKPYLPDQVAKEECNSLGESIHSTANTSRNRVQPVRSCKDATRHTVNLLHVNSEVENRTLSSHDPPMPSTSVIEVSSDDDNEELIDLKGKQRELLENVSATPDSVSFDNGDESFVDLTQEELVENVAHSVGQAPPPGDIISVQGYSVKQSIAPILEAIFKKHGNITADCFLQKPSVITYFLEVICEAARLIETSDVTTIISKMEEIEFLVSEAEAVNIDMSWLQAQLKDIHTRNEALEKTNSLMEMKVNTILVKRAARTDLIERGEELVAAQKRCVKAEECIKVLDLVKDKPISTIIAKRAARADLRERCRELVVAQEQFAKAERCMKVLELVEEKLSNKILESKAENNLG
ncbi:phospholipase-like protein [Artemisia annua]|uniref:Phospholipase-like protein n=1 Tax=Artemisia annua TaxID=35608 RepID=A0A2U1Q0V9_ARTAN|nr:phospholipase-like protein [Artemisia annua]